LVGVKGEALGIVNLTEAFAQAEELDTDLVEIAPKAAPPVCRLMDFGKYKYAQSKQMHAARMKQKMFRLKKSSLDLEQMMVITILSYVKSSYF